MAGLEPAHPAWKAGALPLGDIREKGTRPLWPPPESNRDRRCFTPSRCRYARWPGKGKDRTARAGCPPVAGVPLAERAGFANLLTRRYGSQDAPSRSPLAPARDPSSTAAGTGRAGTTSRSATRSRSPGRGGRVRTADLPPPKRAL